MRKLLDLFLTFARIGGLTFGGGYAMLPILQREVVEKRKWASNEELMDYYSIGQCTPGIIAVNTATFIGYKEMGIIGGIIATIGVVFPSLVIITVIASFIGSFMEFQIVNYAFAGIRVCVCVLILNAVINLMKSSVIDRTTTILFTLVFLLSITTRVSTIAFIVISGVIAVVVNLLKEAKK